MGKFNQLCVWPGILLEDDEGNKTTPKEVEEFLKKSFDIKTKFKCEIKTNPDLDEDGNLIEDTGGRNDIFFYLHDDDISKFAIPRIHAGIRWWEDVIKYNDNSFMYPEEFLNENPPLW